MNYYLGDLHFGHQAVLAFDQRPFADLMEMQETMITNWNTAVKPKDTVYILGDFCWGKRDEWLGILHRLRGQKVLIEGNHDLKQHPPELRNCFNDIKLYKEVEDLGRKVILSHYPILFYKHSNSPKYYMLCGHVHLTKENELLEQFIAELKETQKSAEDGSFANCAQIYNVGCMMPWMQYTPRTLDEIVARRAQYLQYLELLDIKE